MTVVKAERFAATAPFALIFLLCLASLMFTLVRCAPNPIERDLEIDCTWNGALVSANLKWTEPEANPATAANTDTNAGSKTSQSGTTSSQANKVAINTQQALMLTGAASGAALAGGGILVKKKLEGSSSSEQGTKQTTSTSTTSSTAPKGTPSASPSSGREMLMQHQNELKPSTQGQSTTQSQSSTQNQQPKQSNAQNHLKGDGQPTTEGQQYMQKQVNSQSSQQRQSTNQAQRLVQSDVQNYQKEPTSTSSTISASAATITRELLMQKQMDSLMMQSVNSTSSTLEGGTQQPKQATAPSDSSSRASQNLGLLASSSSSAACIATEMWPQRQKEFERLAKKRSDLAAKFSIPSYSTGFVSSFTSATGNAWARLQDFGSAVSNGLSNAYAAIKPYAPAILLTVILVTSLYGGFTLGLFGAGMTGAGMASAGAAGAGMGLGGGAGLVGAGIVAGGVGTYAAYNLGIMNYPQQPRFEAKHTQYIQQQQTPNVKNGKGSGPYGEDPAKEQLDQAGLVKDRIIESHGGPDHQKSEQQAEEWLQKRKQTIERKYSCERDPETGFVLSRYGKPDIITKDYIVECKKGTYDEINQDVKDQALDLVDLIKFLKWRGHKKTLIYWFLDEPTDQSWKDIIDMLEYNGAKVLYGPYGSEKLGGG